MKKIITCQPVERKRTYDKIIVGSLKVQSKLLEPHGKYEIIIKRIK